MKLYMDTCHSGSFIDCIQEWVKYEPGWIGLKYRTEKKIISHQKAEVKLFSEKCELNLEIYCSCEKDEESED